MGPLTNITKDTYPQVLCRGSSWCQRFSENAMALVGGKATIDKHGRLVVEEITAKKYNVGTSKPENASAGQVVIAAGEITTTVATSALTEDSLIFVTPERPEAVGSKRTDENQFEITLKESLPEELKVNWWIVN